MENEIDISINCKNCSNPLNGRYCSKCAQKFIDKRFTLKDSILSVLHAIFNTDHG